MQITFKYADKVSKLQRAQFLKKVSKFDIINTPNSGVTTCL